MDDIDKIILELYKEMFPHFLWATIIVLLYLYG